MRQFCYPLRGGLFSRAALDLVGGELLGRVQIASACIAAELIGSRTGWAWHDSETPKMEKAYRVTVGFLLD